VSSIGNLLPHSYREHSKRVLTYLIESGQDHIKVDSNGKQLIIQGKSYNLLDLIYYMVTNRKGLLSFDSHLYNFLNTLNFPKSLISNKQILKKLQEHSPSPSSTTTLK
jgi:phosphoribosyl 1,2-cyclic phosphodiesterase